MAESPKIQKIFVEIDGIEMIDLFQLKRISCVDDFLNNKFLVIIYLADKDQTSISVNYDTQQQRDSAYKRIRSSLHQISVIHSL